MFRVCVDRFCGIILIMFVNSPLLKLCETKSWIVLGGVVFGLSESWLDRSINYWCCTIGSNLSG